MLYINKMFHLLQVKKYFHELLYFGPTLAYPLCGAAVQFPLDTQNQSPQTTVTLFFAGWFRSMRNPKWPGDSLDFQFNEIIVVSTGGSIALFGTKTSRPAEHKVKETGSKIFASVSLRVMVTGATPIWLLDSWTLKPWLWEKQHHMLNVGSEHAQPSGELGG